uniref:flagellar basal-body MS-ring/collar protein FliF n=1 Tax=Sphingomonas bacterium TaxID=1895847 RepID=UPI0015756F6A
MSENALATAAPAAPRIAIPQSGPALERVRTFARQPAVARSLPLIGILAALALAALAWISFASGPQRDLFSGLGDADKAAVADTLKSGGIRYALDRDSGAITVNESDYYRAKMLLAQAGLPKSAPDGDAMITSLPMGASRAVEGERLRGAREMDLARTIEAIDSVETAKVHLAVEQPSVFVRDASPASASVMLRLRQGRALSDGQVQAIVNLVASSVPGLSPDHVSVVDQTGHLLSRNGGGDAGADRQVELQQKIEQRYQDQIAKLLTPLVGADGFTSEVHADLDFAEVQATRESFPKDTAVVQREQGGWANDAQGQAQAGGIPGAIANQPPTAPQVTTTPTPSLAPG